MPDLKLCTDNAAMIASAGYYNFIEGKRDELNLNDNVNHMVDWSKSFNYFIYYKTKLKSKKITNYFY